MRVIIIQRCAVDLAADVAAHLFPHITGNVVQQKCLQVAQDASDSIHGYENAADSGYLTHVDIDPRYADPVLDRGCNL